MTPPKAASAGEEESRWVPRGGCEDSGPRRLRLPPETHRNCSDCSRKWEKLKNSNKNWRSRIGGAGAKKTP